MNGPKPVWMSATQNTNQSSPRWLSFDGDGGASLVAGGVGTIDRGCRSSSGGGFADFDFAAPSDCADSVTSPRSRW